jgi:APA family basic amino acid/polyamine antiporter
MLDRRVEEHGEPMQESNDETQVANSRDARFSLMSSSTIVIANMIGTGVFTSLGFQLLEIQSAFVILMLWAVGGLVALCGALSYAELGAALPRSGGEYNFLSRIYHPAAGFVSGWISSTIGFAAPTALVALTSGSYLVAALPFLPDSAAKWVASALVVALAGIHASHRNNSALVQNSFTLVKVALIALFCVAGVLLTQAPQNVHFLPRGEDIPQLFGSAFAVALIYVNYAYTGWNAVTYIAGEVEQPQRTVPRALVAGTVVVAVLYIGLNFTFLHTAPMDALEGKIEIGYISALHIFGAAGAALIGIGLSVLLVSTVSSMTLAGPRVLQVIGEDHAAFRLLAATNEHGVPSRAIWVQAILSLIFILTGSFESILVFAGFTLGLNTLFTVLGVFILRHREPSLARPYRISWFPLPPLVYLLITGWTLTFILIERPTEGIAGLGIVAAGAFLYLVTTKLVPFFGKNPRV